MKPLFHPIKTIGIFSPSSSIVPERFERGAAILKEHGFQLVIHPQTYHGSESGNQYAGAPEQKAEALMDLWQNPEVNLIMASCGGNFSAQFLHLLDFQKMAETPKPIMGFSDTTAILSAFYKNGLHGIFGPTVQTLSKIENVPQVVDIMKGSPLTMLEVNSAEGLKLLSPAPKATITAPVFAATLSILVSLIGTPYFPDLKGHILLLEDIGEELSRLDRMLWQLNQACPFSQLAALGFGEFVDLVDTGRPLGHSFDDILKKHQIESPCPLFTHAPIGHGSHLTPIPLGQILTLDFTPPIH